MKLIFKRGCFVFRMESLHVWNFEPCMLVPMGIMKSKKLFIKMLNCHQFFFLNLDIPCKFLKEVTTHRKAKWKEGRKEGDNEGRKEGRKEERKEGRKEGKKKGREERRKKGMKERTNERTNKGKKVGRNERTNEERKEGTKEGSLQVTHQPSKHANKQSKAAKQIKAKERTRG